MFNIVASVALESFGPYHQSKHYVEPQLEGESLPDLDRRCWRKHQHVTNGTVHIPARAIQMAIVDAAAYSGTKIKGSGNKTWTKKFAAGIAIFEDIDLGIDPETTNFIDIFAHSDGNRESGKRVLKRFPIIEKWAASFDVYILDPIITKTIFVETLEIAGMYIGIGQYRPQRKGVAGRFRVISVEWNEQLRPKTVVFEPRRSMDVVNKHIV